MGSVSNIIHNKFSCRVTGVEPNSLLCDAAHTDYANEMLDFECASLHTAPFPDGWATHILTEARLSLTANPERVLREARRLLSDSGTLMNSELVVTDVASLDDRVKRFLDLLHGGDADLTLRGWKSLLEQNGFDVLESVEEPQIMRSNAVKINRAMVGARLLRRTGRLSLSDYGMGEFEEDFEELASASLSAMNEGVISYASFVSKRSI